MAVTICQSVWHADLERDRRGNHLVHSFKSLYHLLETSRCNAFRYGAQKTIWKDADATARVV
ncbi:MAG: hypothetical protein B6D41_04870 [Chloroflexi bacterium UTCFX4]|nr:MAG: hypothetical protein B6D41_04870 [Chloroflexi bacterium UTCFX4]